MHSHAGLGVGRPCPKRGAIQAHRSTLPIGGRGVKKGGRERDGEREHQSLTITPPHPHLKNAGFIALADHLVSAQHRVLGGNQMNNPMTW